MAAIDLLPGYLTALRAELSAVAELAEAPPAELDADPRRRTDAALRLGRVLDAMHDIARLTAGRGTPRRPGARVALDGLTEGAGRPGPGGPAVHEALPLLTLARHRAAGTLDLPGLPADRLHRALASAARAERWLRAS